MRRCETGFVASRRVALQSIGGAVVALAAAAASAERKMTTCLYVDDGLGRYGFPEGHPLGTDRQGAFLREAGSQALIEKVDVRGGRAADREEIERFHARDYVALVEGAEKNGLQLLDQDTPVFSGVYEASAHVVGAALEGLNAVMSGACLRTLQPIGGLHHAARGHAAGFCVFNDLGVVIETLRRRYGMKRVGYVDIDVHFGDGVYYAFENDPDLIFADIHQDGRTLYPGSGHAHQTGTGRAQGTKLNLPLKPYSGDREFMDAWERVETHVETFHPEFIVFQCGADGLKGDPLASLEYSPAVHAHAAKRLRALADRHSGGRVMAFGGGGYNRLNLGRAWSAVLAAFAA
jgi:acetoin utilization protein AcuC